MLISAFLHAHELFVNHTTGAVLSNLYVHTHHHVFHTLSYAHKCRYLTHSVLSDVVAPLLYFVPLAQHCANVVVLLVVQ